MHEIKELKKNTVFSRMPKLADMRAELRALRKETGHRPISKLKKDDVAKELERLREMRETTPPVAATHSEKRRAAEPRSVDIHTSKESEHKVKPAPAEKKGKPVLGKAAGGQKKSGSAKLEKLLALMENMSDSDEE